MSFDTKLANNAMNYLTVIKLIVLDVRISNNWTIDLSIIDMQDFLNCF